MKKQLKRRKKILYNYNGGKYFHIVPKVQWGHYTAEYGHFYSKAKWDKDKYHISKMPTKRKIVNSCL